MSRKEKEMLMSYFVNELVRKENDLVECQNRMRWRHPDEVDCIEMVIAIARLKVFQEVQDAVLAILSLHLDSD